MPDSPETSGTPLPREYRGPYERWVFDIGRAHALPKHAASRRGYLGALLDGPMAPDDLTEVEILDGADLLRCPTRRLTLWQSGGFTPRYLPVIIDAGGGTAAADSGGGGAGGAEFRVDLPVSGRTVHPKGSAPLPASTWRPAPDVADDADQTMVIVAVIDDGLPFAHRNFRDPHDEERSRIEFCWLQSASSSASEPVAFGTEITRAGIDALIAKHGRDEDALYRSVGKTGGIVKPLRPLDRDATHGSLVMDIAAGFEPGDDGFESSDRIRVIAVQLPDAAGWDTSGFGKEMFVLSAMHYIFDRADKIAEGYGVTNPHLLINFSHGISGGPHDGSSPLERSMSELIQARRKLRPGARTELAVPSGNMHLGRLHGVITDDHLASSNGSHQILWHLQPNDRTSSYLELWFEPEVAAPGRFSIAVSSPDGTYRHEIDPLASTGGTRAEGRTLTAEIARKGRVAGLVGVETFRNGRRRVLVALGPTETLDPSLPPTPPGDWTVTVRRVDPTARVGDGILCYIQRDEDLPDRDTGARQSWLEDPLDRRPDAQDDKDGAFLRRHGALNGIGTGAETLVIAGHVETTGHPAPYSSAGRADGRPGKGIATSAVSERSDFEAGVQAAGTRSGTRGTLSGTSSATPEFIRSLSKLLLQADPKDISNSAMPDVLALFDPDADDPASRVRLGRRFRQLRRRTPRHGHNQDGLSRRRLPQGGRWERR